MLTLILRRYFISIFTHLKLYLATTTHNFNWVIFLPTWSCVSPTRPTTSSWQILQYLYYFKPNSCRYLCWNTHFIHNNSNLPFWNGMLTLILLRYFISIFTHLKLYLSTATHNLNWVIFLPTWSCVSPTRPTTSSWQILQYLYYFKPNSCGYWCWNTYFIHNNSNLTF